MVLSAQNISKQYKKQTVLDRVSFSVAPGQALGVTGHNGSGKSTLLSIVAQMLPPDGGQLLYQGKNVLGDRAFLRRMVGYVPQHNALLDDVTVKETLAFFARLYGISPEHIFAPGSAASAMGLEPLQKKRIKTLSGGMQKRLSIALALLHTPSFLLLDEVLGALDRNFRNAFQHWMHAYLKSGGAIIYCSHEAEELRSLCSHMLVLKNGKVIFHSPIADFPSDAHAIDEMLTPAL